MSRRWGSVESVVFPVPDSPKKSAVLPARPSFAEQCIVATPCRGSDPCITVKIAFLISPAY